MTLRDRHGVRFWRNGILSELAHEVQQAVDPAGAHASRARSELLRLADELDELIAASGDWAASDGEYIVTRTMELNKGFKNLVERGVPGAQGQRERLDRWVTGKLQSDEPPGGIT